MIRLDESKLAKLHDVDEKLDRKYGLPGTPGREELRYKGFAGSIEYSKEDDCLFGKVINIDGLISYEGRTLTELRYDFEQSIEFYLSDKD